jgi:polysaccharide pyruvyl transferase WcaK-like protein
MRYHACLFAYLNNVPLLIIDYHPKCRALAEEIELPDNAIISLSEILTGGFAEHLRNLIRSPDKFLANLPIKLARNKARAGIKIING